jgi:hypothetical protein
MFEYYYNQSLRKLIVGFGSLFSKIHVEHKNETGEPLRLEVPLVYSSQEKFIQRLYNPSSITDGTRIETQLPRMSFIMNNIVPDASRRRNRYASVKNLAAADGSCNSDGLGINNQIPVNIGFNLFIYTRHIDDMLQIIEQIMPFFVPDHVISIDLNEAQQNMQIPIVMVSNNLTDRYEGDFNSRRLHIASFTFVAKSYIYGKINSISTITTSDNNIVEFE